MKPNFAPLQKSINSIRCQWFLPVILATWEVEIGRISQSKTVHKTSSQQKKVGHGGTCLSPQLWQEV
jgi:hypothetical protein